jgi:ABC-type transport system involved in multi-copper enzyme maturation permease subunit
VNTNPVLGRELRERMRSGRSFAIITLFLLLLTGLVAVVFTLQQSNNSINNGNIDFNRLSGTGRVIYDVTVLGLLALLLLFLPAIAAGAIAGERERQTLVPLQITLLTPRSILWGKVMASASYVGLLLVAALPLFAVSYQLGGITLWEAGRGVVALLVVAVVFATAAVGCSAIVKRVQGATVLAYLVVFGITVAAPCAFIAATAIDASRGSDQADAPTSILLANPVVAIAYMSGGNLLDGADEATLAERRNDAQNGSSGINGNRGILREIRKALAANDSINDDGVLQFGATGSVLGVPNGIIAVLGITIPAAALFVLGARRLRTPARTER